MNTRTTTLLTFLFATLFSLSPILSQAHCDSMDGPVVKDAQAALENGDITPILKWITDEQEAEVESVFREVLNIREKDEEVQQVADRHFFETVVRLHRQAEGAPYTGLKPAGTDFGPAITAADEALKDGSLADVHQLLMKEIEAGLHHYYEKVQELKDFDPEDVEAARKYVNAYVKYMHYVEPLYQTATSEVEHSVGGDQH
ncbi:MAG TPA: DUF6448 family protein [Gracilimonas sp.]|uniref:DUF6448 family protein n=1 Tax=Gracilimonas sp. TaxID=1974203 RepID=UPI002DA4AB13|nr:DUF6448 family protein [Gracilimonas sp.]